MGPLLHCLHNPILTLISKNIKVESILTPATCVGTLAAIVKVSYSRMYSSKAHSGTLCIDQM